MSSLREEFFSQKGVGKGIPTKIEENVKKRRHNDYNVLYCLGGDFLLKKKL